MSLLDRIQYCRQRDARFRRFVVAGQPVGWVGESLADRLRGFPRTFAVDGQAVRLADSLTSFDARTRALAETVERLREEGWFPGWRDEVFPVGTSFHAPPLLQIERRAARHFGIRCYCVQLNGIVENGGEPQIWIARRSATKPLGPGKLDQIVGGGVPAGMALRACLVKECAEEASIPQALAARARPVGAIAYLRQQGDIADDVVLFNYDLALPPDFTPANADGEVAGFELWPLERVKAVLSDTDDFLFDVALSLIDFLIRHGHVGPADAHYIDIAEGLWSAPAGDIAA
jgi:8-oxo-dGTP pyrophosphatase MutT (NUDIX family)